MSKISGLLFQDQLWYPSRWKQVILLYFCLMVLMYFLRSSTSHCLLCKGTRFYAPHPFNGFRSLIKSKGLPWDLNKLRLEIIISNNIHYLLLHWYTDQHIPRISVKIVWCTNTKIRHYNILLLLNLLDSINSFVLDIIYTIYFVYLKKLACIISHVIGVSIW